MCPVCIEWRCLYDRVVDVSLYCDAIMTNASTIQQLIIRVTFGVLLNKLGEKPGKDMT